MRDGPGRRQEGTSLDFVETLRALLGMEPERDPNEPPDWWKEMDANPLIPVPKEQALQYMSAASRMDNARRLETNPEAAFLDFIPTKHRTEEEHEEAAKYWSDRGYTYRGRDYESTAKSTDVPGNVDMMVLPTSPVLLDLVNLRSTNRR